MTGVRLVKGAAKKAARVVRGWAKASKPPMPLGIALARNQYRAFSPARLNPWVAPIQAMELTMSKGIAQPTHFQIGEAGAMLSMSSRSTSWSAAMARDMPSMWPAPTTATIFWPGVSRIF